MNYQSVATLALEAKAQALDLEVHLDALRPVVAAAVEELEVAFLAPRPPPTWDPLPGLLARLRTAVESAVPDANLSTLAALEGLVIDVLGAVVKFDTSNAVAARVLKNLEVANGSGP